LIFETSDSSARMFGFIDKEGKFTVTSQAEVLEICKKFQPLSSNYRKNRNRKVVTEFYDLKISAKDRSSSRSKLKSKQQVQQKKHFR